MNKLKHFTFLLALLCLTFTACNKEGCIDASASNFDPDANTDDGSCIYPELEALLSDNGNGLGTRTLYADSIYLLDGFVFVNEGQILTIEPGTIIKGKAGNGSNASALIVAQGGKIMADGTASNPIIFTSESDDVSNTNDIPAGERGLWGGLIILGKASLNSTPGTSAIEGLPTSEPRGTYGGTLDTDNSGSLTYISIRYGGTEIGAGNEINGLTLAGVGSGTTVHHVEVVYNKDDGFEFFGGTVNTSHLIAAFCGDDCFDYDEGFRGNGQFWFAIQAEGDGDRAGEHDGGTDPETATPYATPHIRNATYIGRGESAGKRAITFRDNAGGMYYNSIFAEYGKGVDIELLGSGECSVNRASDGELALEGNVFHNVSGNDSTKIFAISVGSGVDPEDSTIAADDFEAYFVSAGNMIADPGMTISRTNDGGLNPIPSNSTILTGALPTSGSFFENVTYKGAFNTGDNWAQGWSFLSSEGYLQ